MGTLFLVYVIPKDLGNIRLHNHRNPYPRLLKLCLNSILHIKKPTLWDRLIDNIVLSEYYS